MQAVVVVVLFHLQRKHAEWVLEKNIYIDDGHASPGRQALPLKLTGGPPPVKILWFF